MSDTHEARVEAAVEEARKHRHIMVAPGPHKCSCGAVLDGFAEAHSRHRAKATLAAADAKVTVDQIERAIMGRTATAGAKAVMALLRGEAGA